MYLLLEYWIEPKENIGITLEQYKVQRLIDSIHFTLPKTKRNSCQVIKENNDKYCLQIDRNSSYKESYYPQT